MIFTVANSRWNSSARSESKILIENYKKLRYILSATIIDEDTRYGTDMKRGNSDVVFYK